MKKMESVDLSNGVQLIVLDDSELYHDVVIKFKNYGSMLDKHTKINGFQHLLEHAIFNNNKNFNVVYNASTTVNYMTVEIDLDSIDYYPEFSLLKKWLFKNDDYRKIDISRNLNLEEVNFYVDELESEFEYRNILQIPWDLQTFLLHGGGTHYFGGNKNSLSDKKQEIQKQLLNPVPIPPENIVIYFKKSKLKALKNLKELFEKLEPINNYKKPLLQYDHEKFYNKVIQINSSNTNSVVFLVDSNLFNYETLYFIKLMYPCFYFDDSIQDYYYMSFHFHNIKEIYDFLSILEAYVSPPYLEDIYNNKIIFCDFYSYNDYFDELIILYNNKEKYTIKKLYNEKKQGIDKVFKILQNKIKDKKFFINSTKYYLWNKKTNIGESYNISDINFNPEYFVQNFTTITNKSAYKHRYYLCNKESKTYDLSNNNGKNMILSLKKDLYKQQYLYSSSSSRLNYYCYVNGLINFFLFSMHNNLESYIVDLLNSKSFQYFEVPNNQINLTNSISTINTEYNFVFMIFKTPVNKRNDLLNIHKVMEENVKSKGLSYTLENIIINFEKYDLRLFYTLTKENVITPIFNIIKSCFLSNNVKKINYEVIISNKSSKVNVSSVYKLISCKIQKNLTV